MFKRKGTDRTTPSRERARKTPMMIMREREAMKATMLRTRTTLAMKPTTLVSGRTKKRREEFQHASFGELRLSNWSFPGRIEAFQPDRVDPSQRTITFGIDTSACKAVVPATRPAARGYLIRKVSLLGCAYSTAGKNKVYDKGKRILCTLDASGKSMVIESRKVNC